MQYSDDLKTLGHKHQDENIGDLALQRYLFDPGNLLIDQTFVVYPTFLEKPSDKHVFPNAKNSLVVSNVDTDTSNTSTWPSALIPKGHVMYRVATTTTTTTTTYLNSTNDVVVFACLPKSRVDTDTCHDVRFINSGYNPMSLYDHDIGKFESSPFYGKPVIILLFDETSTTNNSWSIPPQMPSTSRKYRKFQRQVLKVFQSVVGIGGLNRDVISIIIRFTLPGLIRDLYKKELGLFDDMGKLTKLQRLEAKHEKASVQCNRARDDLLSGTEYHRFLFGDGISARARDAYDDASAMRDMYSDLIEKSVQDTKEQDPRYLRGKIKSIDTRINAWRRPRGGPSNDALLTQRGHWVTKLKNIENKTNKAAKKKAKKLRKKQNKEEDDVHDDEHDEDEELCPRCQKLFDKANKRIKNRKRTLQSIKLCSKCRAKLRK